MTRYLLTIFCWFISLTIVRAEERQRVVSKVQHVTIFLNGLQITRTASASVIAGNSTLEFSGISPNIDLQSLQVKAAGDFTILSVKQELDYLSQQDIQKHVEELQVQQKLIKDKIDLQTNALNVYNEEQNMLVKNQVVSGQNSNLDITKLKLALDFQTERLTQIKKKQQAVNDQIVILNTQLQKFNRQIAEVYKGNSKATSNILVTVAAKSNSQSQFTLSYVVKNASWYPTYDIRAKNSSSPVIVAYKANVSQKCGEDWSNIRLTLSTGNPSASGSKPELMPYFLNLGMVYPGISTNITSVNGRITDETGSGMVGVSIKVKGTSIGTVSDPSGNYSIQIPPGSQMLVYGFVGYESQERIAGTAVMNISLKPSTSSLNEVVVTGYGNALQGRAAGVNIQGEPIRIRGVSSLQSVPLLVQQNENQTNITFDIDNPYSIPSDGKQYLVEINQINISAEYEYFTAPKISTDVFLTAKLTNWSQYNFLPGEANLFFDGTYLGKSLLDTRSTNDTLNLSFGTDKSILITRTLQKDIADKQGFFGSNKKETRDWIITVKNRKSQPVNLLVEDQVPVSQNSSIEVETQEMSNGKADLNTGKISWNLRLAPQTEKKLNLKYQVRYPKNQSVIVL